ncbi:MAG: hypothetical protein DRP11_03790, partial [Candidatus Aenigmatarchaeota archaeon]
MNRESYVERAQKCAELVKRGIGTGVLDADNYTIEALKAFAYQGNIPVPGTNRVHDPEKEALTLAE